MATYIGKYEILEELGSGGFGVVYRAKDADLEREIALKVLHPTLMNNPDFIARFRREARAAAALDHPHIVTIHDIGEVDGRYFIAMRLLKGQPLNQMLAQHDGMLPIPHALTILNNIAAALDYAHSQGVIHRDVKPNNIFVTPAGAVLADFGIVRVLSDVSHMTTTGQVMGTPEYMAPEQILGQDIGPQTDIYALGIVAYQMLTGRVPFSGTTPYAVQEGHIHAPLPSARTFNAALPAGIDAIFEKALNKARESRYIKAAEFVGALRRTFEPATSPASSQKLPPAAPVRSVPMAQPATVSPATTGHLPHPSATTLPNPVNVPQQVTPPQVVVPNPVPPSLSPIETKRTRPAPRKEALKIGKIAFWITLISLGILSPIGLILGIIGWRNSTTDENPVVARKWNKIAVILACLFILLGCCILPTGFILINWRDIAWELGF